MAESDEELDYIDDVHEPEGRGNELPEPMVQMTDEEDDDEEKQLTQKIRALKKQYVWLVKRSLNKRGNQKLH